MGERQDVANELLLGDPLVPFNDVAHAGVEVVVGRYHHYPGIGEGRVAGATHHVGVQQGDAPVRHVAFRAQRGPEPAGPRPHHQHVGVDESADLFEH